MSKQSGRDLHRRVEVDLPQLPAWPDRTVAGAGNCQAIFPKPADMELDRPFDPAQGAVDGLAGRHAARKIRNGCTPIAVWIPVDTNEVLDRFHDFVPFKPA